MGWSLMVGLILRAQHLRVLLITWSVTISSESVLSILRKVYNLSVSLHFKTRWNEGSANLNFL